MVIFNSSLYVYQKVIQLVALAMTHCDAKFQEYLIRRGGPGGAFLPQRHLAGLLLPGGEASAADGSLVGAGGEASGGAWKGWENHGKIMATLETLGILICRTGAL